VCYELSSSDTESNTQNVNSFASQVKLLSPNISKVIPQETGCSVCTPQRQKAINYLRGTPSTKH